ncbi:Oxysterol-binding protein-related protein 1 [Hypsibius exemplaris]|uniref:Oxysterol-binding protein n=1 Tax=Hypsibius exemplaris TaxID=2072580 RepID=A0A1W0X343_HYPEX|nr:Oxysterol-binding protein-related protein 1 [Hypsibius exemplaris]
MFPFFSLMEKPLATASVSQSRLRNTSSSSGGDDGEMEQSKQEQQQSRRDSLLNSPTLSFKDKKSALDESFIYHARVGDAQAVKELLDARRREEVDLNVNHLGLMKWDRGCTALHIACYFGHADAVKVLLGDTDIDIDIRNNHWETPLHKAALTGRIDIVHFLVDRGASVLVTDDKGRRASDVAASPEIKTFLKEMENVQRANHATRFIAACRNGSVEQMRGLLSGPNPPEIGYCDNDGNTALHHAVKLDQKEAASLLLEHCGDPHRKNDHGKSCFDLIVSEPMRRILEIKPPLKFVPKCQPLEGVLLKCNRIWNIWRKYWVFLNRGTISFYRSKRDVGNDRARKVYKHLDGAHVKAGRRWTELIVSFADGSNLYLRVPKSSDVKHRDEWIARAKEHIAYSNHYIGMPTTSQAAPPTAVNMDESLVEAKRKLEDLLKAVAGVVNARRSSSAVDIAQVSGVVDIAYSAVQHCLDTLREIDRTREQLLIEERERCRVLENALEVLAVEHEAVLSSVELLGSTGSLSSANSVYYSPPESIADLEDGRSNDDQPLLSPPDSDGDDEDQFHDTMYGLDESFEGTGHLDTGKEFSTGDIIKSGVKMASHTNGHAHTALLERNGDVQQRSKFGGRTTLPVQQFSRTDFSIWSVLKQCIGKDLSKITMPVVFNEPLSFLQRMSEYMEYAQLLDQAGMCDDPVERIIFVSAFAVSACASNADRIGKPFNPLLGETFELSRPELGYHMVSEQVSHHPPVSAFSAASKDLWNFSGSILPKLKFWGKSVEIQPKGVVTLTLKKYNETYTWSNVNCHVNNIIVGRLWIEQYGAMEIVNHTTGLSVVLNFHPTGWSNRELHKVNGYVLDKSKNQLKAIYGKWTEYLRCVDVKTFENFSRRGGKSTSVDQSRGRRTSSVERENARGASFDAGAGDRDIQAADLAVGEAHSPVNDSFLDIPGSKLVWQIEPRPLYCAKYFGFSLFAMGLNELDENMKRFLAPTDCRYRPDIRALENGDLDTASLEKNRLEEKQRAARKTNKRGQDEWTPTWFQFEKNPVTKLEDWTFTERYWDRDYSACPEIY